MADAAVELKLPDAHGACPGKLRRVAFHDGETGRDYVSLTNDFRLAAATIAAVYRRRWQIELFFKWIKQNLQIRSFPGTSENVTTVRYFCPPARVPANEYLIYAYAFNILEGNVPVLPSQMLLLHVLHRLPIHAKVVGKGGDARRGAQLCQRSLKGTCDATLWMA